MNDIDAPPHTLIISLVSKHPLYLLYLSDRGSSPYQLLDIIDQILQIPRSTLRLSQRNDICLINDRGRLSMSPLTRHHSPLDVLTNSPDKIKLRHSAWTRPSLGHRVWKREGFERYKSCVFSFGAVEPRVYAPFFVRGVERGWVDLAVQWAGIYSESVGAPVAVGDYESHIGFTVHLGLR